MTTLDKLTLLSKFFKAHPIRIINKLIDDAYQRWIVSAQEKYPDEYQKWLDND